MYDLTQLKTFVTVVQESHLTRASERLHISQPTASQHIRALESHFGVTLFHRNPRGLEVTAAGRRIAEWAANVVHASHELDQLARQLAGIPAGRLAIGTVADERLMAALPAAVRAVRTRFPMTEIDIEAGNSRTIRQAIKSGELDAGAVVGPVGHDDLKCYSLGTIDYVLVGPKAWRERLKTARPAQVAAMPWIVTGRGTPSHDLIERCLRDEGLDISMAVQVNNASLLQMLVAGEVGIGFMRRQEAVAGTRADSYFVVPGFTASLPLTFIHAQARASDAVLCCFAEALSSAWDEGAGGPPRV